MYPSNLKALPMEISMEISMEQKNTKVMKRAETLVEMLEMAYWK